MELFFTGVIIGIIFGLYLGNKKLRERVNKDGKRLYAQLEKLAGVNDKKKAKKEAK